MSYFFPVQMDKELQTLLAQAADKMKAQKGLRSLSKSECIRLLIMEYMAGAK